jgi:hypothetical protein
MLYIYAHMLHYNLLSKYGDFKKKILISVGQFFFQN